MTGIAEILSERDVQLQLWSLFWVMIGCLGLYLGYNQYFYGQVKWNSIAATILLGLMSWGVFIAVYMQTQPMSFILTEHIRIIMPALAWGLLTEMLVIVIGVVREISHRR